jgi:hypothetical protein
VLARVAHRLARGDRMPGLQRLGRYLERATGWGGSLPELLSSNWNAVATKGRTLIQALKHRFVSARVS